LAHLQFGQVLLASIGATAPFVGLFGTVWGIYHALVQHFSVAAIIRSTRSPARSASARDDGRRPAVAIPAVLAYNLRRNGVASCEAELEGFAHDLREMPTPHGRRTRDMALGRLAERPAPQPMSDINMTPLIDVMLCFW
jgi:biopolymer transport protein ExbB